MRWRNKTFYIRVCVCMGTRVKTKGSWCIKCAVQTESRGAAAAAGIEGKARRCYAAARVRLSVSNGRYVVVDDGDEVVLLFQFPSPMYCRRVGTAARFALVVRAPAREEPTRLIVAVGYSLRSIVQAMYYNNRATLSLGCNRPPCDREELHGVPAPV